MPLDCHRFLDALNRATELVNDGLTGLAAVRRLLAGGQQATGAAGATFTEHGEPVGRVVAATGAMAWALGKPVPVEYLSLQQLHPAWAGQLTDVPGPLGERLLSRGLHGVASGPARLTGRPVGSVHMFFTEPDRATHPDIRLAVLLVANSLAHLYLDQGSPSPAAESADDDRALFLAVTGHELRTPVTVIKGYAATLADRWDALSESARRDAARALAHRADDLAHLVDRLLAAGAGMTVPARAATAASFDPGGALVRAVDELPADLRDPVDVDLPPGLPPAFGDPSTLPTVLRELIRNAVRHGGGEGRIDVVGGADEQTVYLQVQDRGIGIDAADTERAFERYWQAVPTGREHGGGTGLGLYLVRKIVEQQQGWVSLRPRDGGGTVAEVRLPRADGTASPSASGEA